MRDYIKHDTPDEASSWDQKWIAYLKYGTDYKIEELNKRLCHKKHLIVQDSKLGNVADLVP